MASGRLRLHCPGDAETSHPFTSDSGKSFWHFAVVVGADRRELDTAAAISPASGSKTTTAEPLAPSPAPAQQGPEAVLSSLTPLCASSDQDHLKLLAAWLKGGGMSWAALDNPWLLSLAVTFLKVLRVQNLGYDWGLACCSRDSQMQRCSNGRGCRRLDGVVWGRSGESNSSIT
jgi:hypothetical protein